jgi:nucleotide-binding universal stress UspA family protein
MIDRETTRRIVVAIDSSTHGRAAMNAAAALAERLGAELTALYVEDLDLVRLAALPFAREIDSRAESRPFDASRLERRLRADAREAREACELAAEARRVRVRFEVVRGSVVREILLAAEEADILVLGRASSTTRRSAPLGRTAQSVLTGSTRTIAVVPAVGDLGRPVAVVYDGSEASRRSLDLGLRLAGEDHQNLIVLVPEDGERSAALAAEAGDAARAFGIEPRWERLRDGAAALESVLTAQGCRALVIDRGNSLLDAGGILGLVQRLTCPVFVTG